MKNFFSPAFQNFMSAENIASATPQCHSWLMGTIYLLCAPPKEGVLTDVCDKHVGSEPFVMFLFSHRGIVITGRLSGFSKTGRRRIDFFSGLYRERLRALRILRFLQPAPRASYAGFVRVHKQKRCFRSSSGLLVLCTSQVLNRSLDRCRDQYQHR